MKKILLYLMINSFVFTVIATNNPLEKIKKDLLTVLRETGDIDGSYTIENLPNKLIVEKRLNTKIEERMNGVFYVPRFYAHGYAHYLLIDNEKVEFINMKNSLKNNLKMFIDYFVRNPVYTDTDVAFYISDLIETYNINVKLVESEGVFLEGEN